MLCRIETMRQKTPLQYRCYHYDRNDWLKVDVNALLAPWVNRAAEIYRIGKTPAKHIVTYALSVVAVPDTQEIMDIVFEILNAPDTFQRRYGTRLKTIPTSIDILANPDGLQPANPRQVNFMDLVDYWAVPVNRTFGIGIVQCRDVVKIALTFFIAGNVYPLVRAIQGLVQRPDSELFSGDGKVVFPELDLIVSG